MRATKVVAILQVRMTSSRLPGKVLLPLLGQPMLGRQVERIRRSQRIDHLIIATSKALSDQPIAEFYYRYLNNKNNLSLFRGSLDDVLDRYYQACQSVSAEHIVRLTGDCPLLDPGIIDAVIDQHINSAADYTSNCFPPTLPDGLDVEVFTKWALECMWEKARRPSEREHVTGYIVNHPQEFATAHYRHPQDYSGIRLTVDHREDFILVEKIYAALYAQNPAFRLQDIMALLGRHKDWLAINAHIRRNEGELRALEKDRQLGFGEIRTHISDSIYQIPWADKQHYRGQ